MHWLLNIYKRHSDFLYCFCCNEDSLRGWGFLYGYFRLVIYFNTIAYATVTIIFRDNPDKYIGFCGVAYGIGFLSGPTIGSIIYTFTDYTKTFILFGGFIFFGAFALIFLVPQPVNKLKKEGTDERYMTEDEKFKMRIINSRINYKRFMTCKRIFFTIIAMAIVFVVTTFYDAIIAVMLFEFYGAKESSVGFVYLLPLICFCIATPST